MNSSLRRAAVIALFLFASIGHGQASPCSSSCSSLFEECSEDSPGGYTACRAAIDSSDSEFISAGCQPQCEDTAAMAASENAAGGGGDESDSGEEEDEDSSTQAAVCDGSAPDTGLLTFTANAAGAAQLIPCALCNAWSGRNRCQVQYDVPSACAGAAGRSCPLVFFFHGGGGVIDIFGESASPLLHAGMGTAAAGGGGTKFMIGVYVQGSLPGPGWASGLGHDPDDPDDLGFVHYLISTIFRERFLWSSRTYAYGYSSGAALVHRLASNGRMGFTGVAVAATQLMSGPETGGRPPLNYNRPSDEACTRPIGVVSFHGTADGVIPYLGEASGGEEADADDLPLDSVDGSMQTWAAVNGCDTPASYSLPVETLSAIGSLVVEHQTWAGCQLPTENYKIIDGGHDIDGDMLEISGRTVMARALEFFSTLEDMCAAGTRECPSVLPAGELCAAPLEILPQTAQAESNAASDGDPDVSSGDGGHRVSWPVFFLVTASVARICFGALMPSSLQYCLSGFCNEA